MPLDNVEIGRRLARIRFVLGFWGRGQQKKFADEFLNVANDLYSKWENGDGTPRVIYAVKIVESGRIPGLTLDWIYRGDYDFLRTPSASRDLAAAPPREEEPGFRGKRSPVRDLLRPPRTSKRPKPKPRKRST